MSNAADNTATHLDPRAMGKVAVLMGGRSAEREISLMSGNGVLQALRDKGVDAHAFDPNSQNLFALKEQGFERCFITLHGRYGEDGTVQGALELMGIPYTGPGVMASSVGMDKIMTKRIWLAQGISTPAYWQIDAHDFTQASSAAQAQLVQQAVAKVGLPMVVKAPREGSSIGVYKVHTVAETAQAMQAVAAIDQAILCEAMVQGEEYTCPILGSGAQARALPLVHICPPEGNYDYQQKYFTDEVRYICPPANMPAELQARIQQEALQAYRALGCRGWGRVDVMVNSRDQQPYLLEINTSPGMTSHSLVPMSAQATGIAYVDLCLLILASASLDNMQPDTQAGTAASAS